MIEQIIYNKRILDTYDNIENFQSLYQYHSRVDEQIKAVLDQFPITKSFE